MNRPLRILLVEDHADTAATLLKLLELDGYAAAVAGTLAEARRLSEQQPFDLMLADLQMPDGYAWELLEIPNPCRHLKTIAISAHATAEHIARSKQAGFEEHLVKPLNIDRLRAAIRRAAADALPE